MASGLAIGLAQAVLGKLGEIAVQRALNEASLLLTFKEDFKWLQKKFSSLSGCLQYADNQSQQNTPVKEWLEGVRDIAFDAQDIIDECSVEHLYRNNSQLCVANCSQIIFNRKMGKRIRELKDRVTSVIQNGEHLKLFQDLSRSNQPSTSGTSERGAQFRRGSVVMEEDPRAVGLEEKVEEIVGFLEQPALGVLAVVGMGGLGKTFLMQHVFQKIKQRYDHSAWISVSQSCSVRSLQCDLATQINLAIESGISDVLVADSIHGHLEGKRWLVVLDDVWGASVEGDIKQRLGLLTGRKDQCKIVVTTRNGDVAAIIRADFIYDMQQLSEEESWKLFCMFAFPNSVENRPPQSLESLALQIVEKCGRIPLAVKTVAASISNSVGVGNWKSKLRQMKDVQAGGQDHIMEILKLSYNSLPSHLQCCFAYFSFFPEDMKIFSIVEYNSQDMNQDYLIYLWIAEGFIPQENGEEQLDIGLNYLRQLKNLCLVEVNSVRAFYTVHDLLRDMAINISKKHKCEFHLPLQDTRSRRLVLAKKGIRNDPLSEIALHRQQLLRTVSLFENPDITSIPEHLFDHLRLLRVLDLSRTAISALPKNVGKLKLLKILNLSRTQITEVPDCVRRLKSLLFLDLSGCTSLQLLPHWIGELCSLSHLDVRDCPRELVRRMPKGISHLVSLRTLRSTNFIPLSTEENELLNVKDVGNLTNLQEISFELKDVGGLQSVEDGILERLTKMRILEVSNLRDGDILPAFPEKMNAMKDLQNLWLGRFSVPSWVCGMENLTVLYLVECADYPSLQNMPNLHTLALQGDRRCRELPKNFGECGGFPQLVRLFIEEFPVLEELPALKDGAMQSLQVLSIANCPRVKKVAEGWGRLRTLKIIQAIQGSDELAERLKEGGEDCKKIKDNNPHIKIDTHSRRTSRNSIFETFD